MDLTFSLIYVSLLFCPALLLRLTKLKPQTVTLYQVDDSIEACTDQGYNTFLDTLDGFYCDYTAYGIKGDSPGIDATYPDPAAGGYKGPLACATHKPTRVISVSYGGAEVVVPANYTRRQCNELLKLGLQGHTIVWASGDYGVASPPQDGGVNGCLGTVTATGFTTPASPDAPG
jgi:tripeptidyl-peptidase-1